MKAAVELPDDLIWLDCGCVMYLRDNCVVLKKICPTCVIAVECDPDYAPGARDER